ANFFSLRTHHLGYLTSLVAAFCSNNPFAVPMSSEAAIQRAHGNVCRQSESCQYGDHLSSPRPEIEGEHFSDEDQRGRHASPRHQRPHGARIIERPEELQGPVHHVWVTRIGSIGGKMK